jgi:hypothetical protein
MKAMKRALFLLGVAVLSAAVVVPGCEHFRNVSAHHEPAPEAEAEDAEAQASSPPKGFFKSTRLPGAMSEEGSEIERSLGVHP